MRVIAKQEFDSNVVAYQEALDSLSAVLQRGYDDIKNGNYIVLKDNENVWDAIP